jgi:hypothetical protein
MKAKSYLLFITLLLINSLNSYAKIKDESWRFVTKRGAIKILTQDVEETAIRALKAEGEIKSPLINVLTALRDISAAPNWSPFTISKKTIVERSDLWAITHDVLKMPWPLNKRDLIIDYKLELNKKNKELRVDFKSVNHQQYPPGNNIVRAYLHIGAMKLRPSKNGGTWVELTLLFDPMGFVPKWVVNALQITMPVNYLRSLEKYSKNLEQRPLPGIQKIYNELKMLY